MAIYFGDDNDELVLGTPDIDLYYGAGGNDTILGGVGADTFIGGGGADEGRHSLRRGKRGIGHDHDLDPGERCERAGVERAHAAGTDDPHLQQSFARHG